MNITVHINIYDHIFIYSNSRFDLKNLFSNNIQNMYLNFTCISRKNLIPAKCKNQNPYFTRSTTFFYRTVSRKLENDIF